MLNKNTLLALFFIVSLFFFRTYFFHIDECFSDICRHSKQRSLNALEWSVFRVETFPYYIYKLQPFIFYFFDIPLLLLALLRNNISFFNRVGLVILSLQPSYDVLFLIGILIVFSRYRLKIFGFLLSIWSKVEFTLLVLSTFLFYSKLMKRIQPQMVLSCVLIFCSISIFISTMVDTTLVFGPENGKFQGSEQTIIRFFGYLFMPLSSLASYQLDLNWHSNLIRIQTIILAFMFVLKLKNIQFLSMYIIACTIIACIVDFYQLRYVTIFLFAFLLIRELRDLSIPNYKCHHINRVTKEGV